MRMFIVYYKYKAKGEKKPGPVRQFRIYAGNAEEARRMVTQYSTYPDIEVIRIQSA